MVDNIPTWVAQLELSDGGRLAGVRTHRSPEYRQARILVRIHGQPIGFLNLSVPPEGLTLQTAVSEAQLQLPDRIRGHLAEDGVDLPDVPLSQLTGRPVECRDRAVPEASPPFSVVVSTRDRPAALANCLRSLGQLRHVVFEVVVVDNAPSDDEARRTFDRVVGGDERFRYVCEPLQGVSRARNRGLHMALFDHVAFTDDDVVVDNDWLRVLARGFIRGPDVVCVTGLVAAGSLDNAAERYFDRALTWSAHLWPCRYDAATRRSPHFPFDAGRFGTGANFAVDRAASVAIGGFDDALGAGTPTCGGEDLDMFVRLLRGGGVLAYEPSAVVWHFHRAAPDELRRQMRGYGVGFGAFVFKQLREKELRRNFFRQLPLRIWERVRNWFRHVSSEENVGQFVAAEAWGLIRGPFIYCRSQRTAERMRAISK